MKKIFFKTIKGGEFKKIKKERPGCWIHYELATEKDVKEAAKLTHLEYTDLSESLDIYELPRIEKENGATIIYIRVPVVKKRELLKYTELLTIVITKNYFITISKEKSEFISRFIEKYKNEPVTTTQSTKLLLKILALLSSDYTKRVRDIRDNIVKKTSQIDKITNELIVELLRYEEILEEYLLALTPTKNIITAILSGKYLKLYEEDKDLLDDLQISIQQSLDICNITLKNLVAMRDSYQIIFTNELNRVMKFLTGFTILLTIPNIVSGIYGMNVFLPLQKNPHAFTLLLLLIFALMFISYNIFKERNWL